MKTVTVNVVEQKDQSESTGLEIASEIGGSVEAASLARNCPDCGVAPGEQHRDGCDVERCPECGGQMLMDDCELTVQRLPWAGEWPGKAECREFGWYSKMVRGQGWVSCEKDDPGACEDLNRLAIDAVWSKEQGRFILPR